MSGPETSAEVFSTSMVTEAPGWMRTPRRSEDTGKKGSRTKSQNTLTFRVRGRGSPQRRLREGVAKMGVKGSELGVN